MKWLVAMICIALVAVPASAEPTEYITRDEVLDLLRMAVETQAEAQIKVVKGQGEMFVQFAEAVNELDNRVDKLEYRADGVDLVTNGLGDLIEDLQDRVNELEQEEPPEE